MINRRFNGLLAVNVNTSNPLVVGKFHMKQNAAYNAQKFNATGTSQPASATQEAEYIVGDYLQAIYIMYKAR